MSHIPASFLFTTPHFTDIGARSIMPTSVQAHILGVEPAIQDAFMLSIVMVARNVRPRVESCLTSLHHAVRKLGIESQTEFILVDDASDPGQELGPTLTAMRRQTSSSVCVLQFTSRQHYTKALTHAFSIATGQSILFVSHDMFVTPAYIRTLLAVGALDPSFGVIRGTSTYVDGFPNHIVPAPLPLRTMDDVNAFADLVSAYHGLGVTEDQYLTGDSMLIQPAVLKEVGVFDPRYYGYFGDIDFGLRVQRAGFKLVCAKGAWLVHEGAAYYKNEAAAKDVTPIHAARMKLVEAAYGEFRRKWDMTMPAGYPGADSIDFRRLRLVPSPTSGEHQPRLAPGTEISRIL